MAPPPRSTPSPWIEALILGYGGQPSSGERLQARVIRVEPMSQSQAQTSDSPPGLLLLSDGFLLLPAVLTAAAWERLQEQEDRDSLQGLVNSTVVIQDHRLQFHTSLEQNRCRFFLSVGQLATTRVGPPGYSTPCCTTLASVRHKIWQTWREQLEEKEPESQSSQSGLDLSLLLGAWQQDCLLDILKDVEDRLVELQPSASTLRPAHPHASRATGWDVDRLRFREETSFSVPVPCLLLPDVVQLQADVNGTSPAPNVWAAPEDGASGRDGDLPRPPVLPRQESDQPTAAGTQLDASEGHVMGGMIDASVRPPSNPWDIFTPPGHSPRSFDGAVAETEAPAASTSAPLALSSGTQERSGFPPYQPPPKVDLRAPAGLSPSGGAPQVSTGTAGGWAAPTGLQGSAAQLQRPEGQDGEASRSPPSWLFDTQAGGGALEQQQRPQQGAARKIPSVHSDGRAFSYTYRVSGQNLQDLSCFAVRTAWLQWAVRYLRGPEQDPGPR